MNKSKITTLIIIITVVLFAFFVLNKNNNSLVDAQTAECIGQKSELYVQLGCPHCKTQEDMFGSNLKYIKITDCFYATELCNEKGIEATPTWIINGQKYRGVQSIEKLKELTGC